MMWLLLAMGGATDFVPATPTNQSEWMTGVTYPDTAAFADASGLTQADIFVDKTGKPRACYVVVSSGAPDLDGQTCAAAMHRGRFTAARDETGTPMAGVYRFRLLWSLQGRKQQDYPADVTLSVPKLPGNRTSISMTLRYIVDVRGHIEQCAPLVSSGLPQVDAAACNAMPGRYNFAPARDNTGTAWRAVRTQTVTLEVSQPTARR